MAYTNKGNIQNYLMVDIDNSFDTQISNWITAVENYINKVTNNPDGFGVSSAATRYFDGNGKTELVINNFVSISSVEILELEGSDVDFTLTEGIDNDFITFPYNATLKYKLIMTANSSAGVWYEGKQRIKISAVWGSDSSVPKDIELAATMLTAQIVEKGLKGGTVKAESLGDYSVTFASVDEIAKNMKVKDILDKYKQYIL